jgi:hypothetical protein
MTFEDIISKKYNGRVDILTATTSTGDGKLFQEVGPTVTDVSAESLYSIQQVTPLSRLFFSRENQKIIQNSIRRTVWEKTSRTHIIGDQDALQLQLVMRSIYLQYCRNIPTNLTRQVGELNAKVCDYCVDRVYNNLLQFITYQKDVSTLPVPLPQPVSVVKERKQSIIMPDFF